MAGNQASGTPLRWAHARSSLIARTAVLFLLPGAAVLLSCRQGEVPPSPPPSSLAPSTTLAMAPSAPPPPVSTRPPAPPSSTLAPKAPTPEAATPTPTPAAPVVDTARVARLVSEGESALAQDRLPQAEALFTEALALDPSDERARLGKARTATITLGLTRTFVPDLASADGAEGKVKEIDGFDLEELDVRQAARIPGRAELEAQPGKVKPGDTYTVKVYLRNQSRKKKRTIKISGLNVRKVQNGTTTPFPAALLKKEVAPKERVLIATLSAPWDDDVSSYTLDVRVMSELGDIYQNRLFWK